MRPDGDGPIHIRSTRSQSSSQIGERRPSLVATISKGAAPRVRRAAITVAQTPTKLPRPRIPKNTDRKEGARTIQQIDAPATPTEIAENDQAAHLGLCSGTTSGSPGLPAFTAPNGIRQSTVVRASVLSGFRRKRVERYPDRTDDRDTLRLTR